MAAIINEVQLAFPQARLMWHAEGAAGACVIASFKDEEHYLGIALDEPGLTAEILVSSIITALT